MNGVVRLSVCVWQRIPNYTFCMGKPYLSDIFLRSETKCRIFLDIVFRRDFVAKLKCLKSLEGWLGPGRAGPDFFIDFFSSLNILQFI